VGGQQLWFEMAQNDKYSCRNERILADNGGVYFVPALTGLGAPHGLYARRNSGYYKRNDKRVRIAYQVYDLAKSMKLILEKGKELKVDGGAAVNNLMMQFQPICSDLGN
jgi:glycerol kinase